MTSLAPSPSTPLPAANPRTVQVSVDTSGLYTIQAGVARYIRGLLSGFKALSLPDFTISELAWEVENFGYRQPQRALKTFYRELIWVPFLAPRELTRRKAELLHSTVGYFVKPPAGVRNVVTLHDLAHVRHPERFRKWQQWAGKWKVGGTLTADRVICISQFSADEAMTLLGLPAKKIDVVHNGCDFHPDNPPAPEAKPDFPVPDEFFLFVGSLEPGKNLSLLKESYRLARERGRSLPPLMIVGARWVGVPGEGAPLPDWHYLGRQPDEVLVFLYRRALALAFPSKYEGFGLPVAEAMALGCPVVCSKIASLPEVAGDAALYAELNPENFAEALRRVSEDATLRRDLRERGLRQARRFSWRKCASETADVYRKCLAQQGG